MSYKQLLASAKFYFSKFAVAHKIKFFDPGLFRESGYPRSIVCQNTEINQTYWIDFREKDVMITELESDPGDKALSMRAAKKLLSDLLPKNYSFQELLHDLEMFEDEKESFPPFKGQVAL